MEDASDLLEMRRMIWMRRGRRRMSMSWREQEYDKEKGEDKEGDGE